MEFEYKEKLDKEIEEFINSEFEIYANEHNLSCKYSRLNFVAKEQNKIIGVLTAYTVYDELYIDELIIELIPTDKTTIPYNSPAY